MNFFNWLKEEAEYNDAIFAAAVICLFITCFAATIFFAWLIFITNGVALILPFLYLIYRYQTREE